MAKHLRQQHGNGALVRRIAEDPHAHRIELGGVVQVHGRGQVRRVGQVAEQHLAIRVVARVQRHHRPESRDGDLEPGAMQARPHEGEAEERHGHDRAARPVPGRTEPLHRLNRTEYQNAVRDLLALDIESGATLWKASRDELPSWGTPNIYSGAKRVEVVTNASNFIRGYDPETGKELWRLGGSSQITAPTPIFSQDLIVVASGRRPEAPIFVIRAGASGDITLSKESTSSKDVVWSRQQRGSYMPTPLIYGDKLYVLGNQGVFDCYELRSGKELYRQRIEHAGGGFSSSPVAADGRIYLSSEDGDIFVVKAGAEFQLLGTNPMGERLMATPALSDGRMYVRGEKNLFAVGR